MRIGNERDLESSITSGLELRARIWELSQEIFTVDKRSHAVFRFLSVALQHQDSVVVLIKNGSNDSSALALLRCLKDTCERGVWVAQFADETQVQTILEGEFDYKPVNVYGTISEKYDATISKETRDYFHSLTHTGYEQLSAQYSEQHHLIEPSFDVAQLRSAIRVASALLAMLAAHSCSIVSRKDLATRAWSIFRDFFRHRESA